MRADQSAQVTAMIARSSHRDMNWLARSIEREPGADQRSLSGLSFVTKDLFALAGEPNRAGSAVFDNDPPAAADAPMVARALSLGARLVGTGNMDALAYGFVCNSPEYGIARNPHDRERICGGSSGGSAAMVASGHADFALGTDTSGSIRIPSAFCGVHGYKPTLGVFDMSGIAPLSPTFDRPGLFARDGKSLQSITHSLALPRDWASGLIDSPRIGLLGGYFAVGLEPAVERAVRMFADDVSARGLIELDGVGAAWAATYLLVAFEAAQIYRAKLAADPSRFDSETRDRLAAACLIEPHWRTDALRVQHAFAFAFDQLFDEFDILIAPCVGIIAPLAANILAPPGDGSPPLRAVLGRYTQPVSLAGVPVVSVPLATDAELPTAVQVIARTGSDAMLLDFVARLDR